jgi:lactate dehydrogenase-like 2-hydroxyacid dehydrogenase
LQAGDPPARADVVDVYRDPANCGQRQGRPEDLAASLSLPAVNLNHACATSDRGFSPSYVPSYHCDLASVKFNPATMANRGESVVEPVGAATRRRWAWQSQNSGAFGTIRKPPNPRKHLTFEGLINTLALVLGPVAWPDAPRKEAPVRPKVLVSRQVFDEALALLSKSFEVESNQRDVPFTPIQLVKKLQGKSGAIVLLTDMIDDRLLAQCPDLKVVCNVAVGYNNVDVKAATRRGIMICNTPGVLDDTTADFTWTLLLATARRVVESDKFFRAGKWKGWGLMQFTGYDVHHKTLGVVGFGRIGKGVARRAKGFDMRVIYTDVQRVDEATEREYGVMYVDKRTLLRESDFVSLHIPLFPETRHYLSDPEFGLMKRTAILVNAARGPIVDEKALVKALRDGKIAGAGLDVYEREPKCERALIAMKQVVLAPHTASASIETRTKMAMMAVQNCIAGVNGQRPANIVNPEVLAR